LGLLLGFQCVGTYSLKERAFYREEFYSKAILKLPSNDFAEYIAKSANSKSFLLFKLLDKQYMLSPSFNA